MEVIRKIVIAAIVIAASVCIYLGVRHYASTSQVDNVAIQISKKDKKNLKKYKFI